MTSLRHDPKPLVRLVHLLLLVGWLFSSHGIAPAICMAAAVLDGDHAVKVRQTNDGALTVVLSHAGKTPAELTAHEHDMLCRMLVAFSAAPSSGGGDHVLAFKPVDDTSRTQRPLPSMQSIVRTVAPSWMVVFRPAKISHIDSTGGYAWSPSLALKSGRTVMRC